MNNQMALELAALVKSYVTAQTEPLLARIAELESRTPEKGEKGDTGPAGLDGAVGPQGERGAMGERGEKGDAGPIGERGPEGPAGVPGRDGRDGVSGATGERGEKGEKGDRGETGRKGERGEKGEDGFSLEDLQIEHSEDFRSVTLKFIRGELKREWTLKLPVMIYRGVYQQDHEYETGDCVTYGGGIHVALRETKEPPRGEPSGWRLAVKPGRDGKDYSK